MEKILAVKCSAEQISIIKSAASALRIQLQIISSEQSDERIEDIMKTGVCHENEKYDGLESLLIFCSLTEKHLDHMLAKLREKQAGIYYKAILTSVNRSWSIKKLYVHMEMEKRSIEGH